MQEKQSHCHLENATTALRFFCEKIYYKRLGTSMLLGVKG
jgi:hypothetical protein